MGEYAKRKSDGQEVKIGTCETMYYLRYEDRNEVSYAGSLNGAGLFWRLPYPDEDSIRPGEYKEHNRGLRLWQKSAVDGYHTEFSDPTTTSDPGTIQFTNGSGMLLNVKCYHGEKLPEASEDFKPFWNGKSWFYELAFVKKTEDGFKPVIRCRHCGQMWRYEWSEVLPFVNDLVLKFRLMAYAEEVVNA